MGVVTSALPGQVGMVTESKTCIIRESLIGEDNTYHTCLLGGFDKFNVLVSFKTPRWLQQ